MTDISTQHPEYAEALTEWVKIEDITREKNLHQYLITLNPQDKSKENQVRNQQYRERAQFYALAGETAQGMLGTVFGKWPTFKVPPELEYLSKNADGVGNSIYQQSQGLTDDVIRKGRAGLAVSFPTTQGEVTREQMQSGDVSARIDRYEPEQILNWRTVTEGSRTKLSLVVLYQKEYEEKEGQYEPELVELIREMYLEEGVYKERQWRKSSTEGWTPEPEFTPQDATGQPWQEIPFTFVGSENNDTSIDHPPMKSIVNLNIGHYRNSADYEDSVFYNGQSQPWMSAVGGEHIRLMEKEGVYIGSRKLLPVPEGGEFGFAQAAPNTLVRQAMMDKVDLMIGLGARILQPGSAVKTAEQAAGERETQHSKLSLIASNVSEAYSKALVWVGRYMGVELDPDEHGYTVNQDYTHLGKNPQELRVVMEGFLQGTMPLGDYVRYMQKEGLFDEERTPEEYADLLPVGSNEQ